MNNAAAIPSFPRTSLGLKQQQAQVKEEKPQAEFYLNVGQLTQIERHFSDGTSAVEEVFVSLPYGIGLDTMTLAADSSSNEEFAALMGCKNDLLRDILEWAQANVKPGEAVLLPGLEGALRLQIRRVGAKKAPIEKGNNPYYRAPMLSL